MRVASQAELDRALADAAEHIVIDSPAGVALTIGATGASRVDVAGRSRVTDCSGRVGRVTGSGSVGEVTDSGSVEWVTGSGRVGRVTGSGRVGEVTGSGRVGWVTGSGRVEWVTGSGRVEWVTDSGSVGEVTGSGRVEEVTGSGSVGRVTGSGSVEEVTGSGRVGEVTGSGSVGRVTGSGRVGRVTGSGRVHMHDESTLGRAGSHATIYLHSQSVTLGPGGVVIDMTAVDLGDPEQWLSHHAVEARGGKAVLYKAVGGDWRTPRGSRWTYRPGATVVAEDFHRRPVCGGGLHLSPTPRAAREYHGAATKYVACEVAVADLVPIDDGGTWDKAKVPSCVVLHEVTVDGERVDS